MIPSIKVVTKYSLYNPCGLKTSSLSNTTSMSPLILPLKNHIRLTSKVLFQTNRIPVTAFLEWTARIFDQSHHPQRVLCVYGPAGSH